MRSRDRKAAVLSRLRPIKKRERPFENRLRDHLETNYAVMFVKAKPTRTGFPDRIAMGYGNTRLVEVKADDDPGEAQEIVHAQIRELSGQAVVVIDAESGIDTCAKVVVRALRKERLCGCVGGAFCGECY